MKFGEELRWTSDGPKGGTSGDGYAADVGRVGLVCGVVAPVAPAWRRTEVHGRGGADRMQQLGVAAGRRVAVARRGAAAGAGAGRARARLPWQVRRAPRALVVSPPVFFLGFYMFHLLLITTVVCKRILIRYQPCEVITNKNCLRQIRVCNYNTYLVWDVCSLYCCEETGIKSHEFFREITFITNKSQKRGIMSLTLANSTTIITCTKISNRLEFRVEHFSNYTNF